MAMSSSAVKASGRNIWQVFLFAVVLCVRITSSDCVSVTAATYRTLNLPLDDLNYYRGVLFTADFDEDLFVHGVRINETALMPGETLGPMICWGPNVCNCSSPITSRLYGTVTITCGLNVTKAFWSPCGVYSNDGAYLIPVPPSDDPFMALMTDIGIVNYVPKYRANRLSYLYFNEMRYHSTFWTNEGFYINHPETCTIDIHNIQNEKGEELSFSIPKVTAYTPKTCDFLQFQAVSIELQDYIAALGSTISWYALNDQRWRVILLTFTEAWIGCWEDASTKIIKQSKEYQSITKYCPYQYASQEWINDPCCNAYLAIEVCCVPRAVHFASDFLGSPVEKSTNTCKSPFNTESILLDMANQYNAGQDPSQGCVSNRRKLIDDTIYNSSQSFIIQCHMLIFGDGSTPACTSDADCKTFCLNNRCQIPIDDWIDMHMNCYIELMPSEVRSYLELYFGIPLGSENTLFKEAFRNRTVDINCQGQSSNILTGTGKDYKLINETACMSDKKCNWNPSLSEEECLLDTTESFCGYCRDNTTCQMLNFDKGCYSSSSLEHTCAEAGGSFDKNRLSYPCRLPESTIETCLPSSICPSPNSTSSFKDECSTPMCYLEFVDRDTCTAFSSYYYTWEPTFANGTGLCIASIIKSKTICELFGFQYGYLGFKWWPGKTWTERWMDTKDKCDQNACASTYGVIVGSNAEQCPSAQSCVGSCPVSVSEVDSSIYYHQNITAEQCSKEGGMYDSDYKICILDRESETCKNGLCFYEDCAMLNLDQCFHCIYNLAACELKQKYLKCAIDMRSKCAQDACQEGGYCNNKYLYRKDPRYGCLGLENEYLMTGKNWQCFGACNGYFGMEADGTPYCGEGEFMTRSGCVNLQYNLTECLDADEVFSFGFIGMSKLYCEVEDRYGNPLKGCVDNPYLLLTGKNQTECDECGGYMEKVYTWTPGQWKVGGRKLNTTWREKQYVSVNHYVPTLNQRKVYDVVEAAIVAYFSNAFRTESLCRFNPLASALGYYACDCTNTGGPSTCFSDSARNVSVGVQRFCRGISDWLKTGPFEVFVTAQSVPKALICMNVQINLHSASQHRRNPSDSLSSDQLTGSGRKIQNQYAVIQYEGFYVGQLIGDGIEFRDGNGLKNISVCAKQRADIPIEPSFSQAYFVFRGTNGNWFPLIDNSVVVNDETYCISTDVPASLSKGGGIIYPALFDPNWMNYTDDVKVEPYVVFLLLCECVLAVWSGVMITGSFLLKRKKRTSINMNAIFGLVLLFATFRAIFFGLQLSDLISDGSDLQLVLYDFPVAIYFMMFSVLLFFWIEISDQKYAFQTQTPENLKHSMRVFNAIIISIFVTLIITNNITSSENIWVALVAYYSTLVSLSGAMAIGYLYYGIKVIRVIDSLSMAEISKRQREHARKITLVTAITAVGLLVKSVWTLVSIYVDESNVNIICTIILLTEIIPCATLLLAFGAFPKSLRNITGALTKTVTSRWYELTSTGSANASHSDPADRCNHPQNPPL